MFSKTTGFRHASIAHAIAALTTLANERDWTLEATEDATSFNDENLARFNVVLFASTTGDVLDSAQEAAMERFIARGNGFVGVHSTSFTLHTHRPHTCRPRGAVRTSGTAFARHRPRTFKCSSPSTKRRTRRAKAPWAITPSLGITTLEVGVPSIRHSDTLQKVTASPSSLLTWRGASVSHVATSDDHER